MTLRFGLSLCPEVGRWRDTVAQARLAEELEYDSVWLPEHHLMAGYAPSPLLGLAGLVEVTSRITLGTDVVIAPFYHPVRLAEDAAVLHEMSDGRLVLGVGLGYRKEEFAAFGVPYQERAARLDETLEIVRRLWSEEDVHASGEHFPLDGVTIYPRLSSPPPLYVGGWGDLAIRRAARLADAYFPGPTAEVEKLARCVALYDQVLAEGGRTRTELPLFREVWVADSPGHLDAGVRALRALYADDYLSWGHDNVAQDGDVGAGRFIVGHPESVAEQLVDVTRRLGVTHLVARLHFHGIDQADVERAMRLLAQEVRPLVTRALA
jgi:probable F420-dependent oxidoreductase